MRRILGRLLERWAPSKPPADAVIQPTPPADYDHPANWPEVRKLPVKEAATVMQQVTDWRDQGLDCAWVFEAMESDQ